MLRIYTLGWLTCPADIEAVRLGNMDVLLWVFGHARADNRKILFCLRPGGARIDEGVKAGPQIGIAHDTSFHGLGVPATDCCKPR